MSAMPSVGATPSYTRAQLKRIEIGHRATDSLESHCDDHREGGGGEGVGVMVVGGFVCLRARVRCPVQGY